MLYLQAPPGSPAEPPTTSHRGPAAPREHRNAESAPRLLEQRFVGLHSGAQCSKIGNPYKTAQTPQNLLTV